MGEEGAKGSVPRRPLDRRWLACALCVVVIALAALAGALQYRANDARQRARFDQLANTATATLHSQLAAFEHGLRGARGAVIAAGPELDRERFHAYSASRDYARSQASAVTATSSVSLPPKRRASSRWRGKTAYPTSPSAPWHRMRVIGSSFATWSR